MVHVRYSLVELSNTAGSPISADLSFAEVGFHQNWATLKKMLERANLDGHPDLSQFRTHLMKYTEECAIAQVGALNPQKIQLISNTPDGHSLDILSPNRLGITGGMRTRDDGEMDAMGCKEFFETYIEAKAGKVAEDLYGHIKKGLYPLDIDKMHDGLQAISATPDNGSTILAGTNAMKSKLADAAIRGVFEHAKANDATGIFGTTDIINASAIGSAKAQLQQLEAGQMQWAVEILPHALAFITGIVYCMGIFPLLMYLFTGSPGVLIAYAKSILSLELVYFSLGVVHNATSFYSVNKAANILAGMEESGTAEGMAGFSAQLDHIATMSGIAGTLGVVVALGLPMLIMRGEVGGMMAGLGRLAGNFRNDINSVAENIGQAIDGKRFKEEYAENADYMRKLGISAPTGVGEMEYYQRIKAGMDRASQGMAAAVAQSDNYANAYQSGATLGAVSQVGNTVGMSHSGLTNQQSFEAGKLGGMSQGINMQQQSAFSNNGDYYKGVERGARQQLEKTRGMGLGSEPSKDDWNSFAQQSSGQFQETFAGAKGYNKEAMDGNNLKKDYAQGLETSSAAKAAGIKGLGGLSDTDQEKYIRANETSSEIKAHQMIGDTAGQLQEFSKAMKESGKELSSVVQELSQTMAQAKTRASIEGIDQVGANSYITNAGRSAAGQQEGLDKAIKTADEQFKIIDENGKDITKKVTGSTGYEAYSGVSSAINTARGAGSTREVAAMSQERRQGLVDNAYATSVALEKENWMRENKVEASEDDVKNFIANETAKTGGITPTHEAIAKFREDFSKANTPLFNEETYRQKLYQETAQQGLTDINGVATSNHLAWTAGLGASNAGIVSKMQAMSLDGRVVSGVMDTRGQVSTEGGSAMKHNTTMDTLNTTKRGNTTQFENNTYNESEGVTFKSGEEWQFAKFLAQAKKIGLNPAQAMAEMHKNGTKFKDIGKAKVTDEQVKDILRNKNFFNEGWNNKGSYTFATLKTSYEDALVNQSKLSAQEHLSNSIGAEDLSLKTTNTQALSSMGEALHKIRVDNYKETNDEKEKKAMHKDQLAATQSYIKEQGGGMAFLDKHYKDPYASEQANPYIQQEFESSASSMISSIDSKKLVQEFNQMQNISNDMKSSAEYTNDEIANLTEVVDEMKKNQEKKNGTTTRNLMPQN